MTQGTARHVDIQRADGGFVVRADRKSHFCATMGEVLELVKSLLQPTEPQDDNQQRKKQPE
jgi:hypothetical protein